MLKNIFYAAMFIFISISLSYAQPAQLPQTGQTTSYASGDDGDIQAGIAWPEQRFTNNGNGTVTDNLTGLVWLRNANCFGTRTWANALINANTLNSGECGLSDGSVEGDWRLPNRKELRSLINYGQANSAAWLNTQGFSNVQAGYYWSSTTYADSMNYAWFVDMVDGSVVADFKPYFYYVWPVRAGGLLGNSDLSLIKTDSPDPVKVGKNITYTITITNNGPDGATGVTLADNLPAGAAFVATSSTQGTCSESSGTVTCSIGDMANAAMVTATIIVTAPNTPGVTLTNTATVSSASNDRVASNNTATANTSVSGGHFIAGKVMIKKGKPVEGVTITLSGPASRTTTTDSRGQYKFAELPNGSFTVTPYMTGKTFTPGQRLVTINGTNANNQDFTMN
jgi:uncharacterized repeat protein (TIGR01451 family)